MITGSFTLRDVRQRWSRFGSVKVFFAVFCYMRLFLFLLTYPDDDSCSLKTISFPRPLKILITNLGLHEVIKIISAYCMCCFLSYPMGVAERTIQLVLSSYCTQLDRHVKSFWRSRCRRQRRRDRGVWPTAQWAKFGRQARKKIPVCEIKSATSTTCWSNSLRHKWQVSWPQWKVRKKPVLTLVTLEALAGNCCKELRLV